MITASHNPSEYNGLKLSGAHAVPINLKTYGVQLQKIMEIIPSIPIIEHDESALESRNIVEEWADHVCSFVDATKLTRKKIVVDAGNGVAGVFMPRIAEKLGLDIVPLYFEPDGTFPHHHPDPLKPENLRDIRVAIIREGADMGIAFDGDADRACILDETGEPLSGTVATAIIASILLARHPGATILSNTVTGNIVRETVERLGGHHRCIPVGHVYIKEAMRDDPSIVFAGEHSGHYYLRANGNADSGIIASVLLLQHICEYGQSVSEIRRTWDPYPHIPETNFKVKDVATALMRVCDALADGEIDATDGVTARYPTWWCNVRPSSNEPLLRLNIEANDSETLENALMKMQSIIASGSN